MCPMYLAHARSMRKHNRRLNDQDKLCLACDKNQEGKVTKEVHNKKSGDKNIKTQCQFCGQEKACKRCGYGGYACTACQSAVALARNHPEVLEKIWERFGPDRPLLDAAPPEIPSIKDIEFEDIQYAIGETTPFAQLLERMAEIHAAKRHDYASHDDCLGNFREAQRLGISPLQGIMVRLTDKYTRACNVIRRNGNHAVENESLEDTLIDMANYSLLAVLAGREEQDNGGNSAAGQMPEDRPADLRGDMQPLPEKVSIRRKGTQKFEPVSDGEIHEGL